MAVLHCISDRRFCAIVTTLTWIAATKTTRPQEGGLTTTPPGTPVRFSRRHLFAIVMNKGEMAR
jgi:hypothetical protein